MGCSVIFFVPTRADGAEFHVPRNGLPSDLFVLNPGLNPGLLERRLALTPIQGRLHQGLRRKPPTFSQSQGGLQIPTTFDALPWLELGRPALALMGVAIPGWLLERLKGKEVYFALNGDEAGNVATRNHLERLQKSAKEIRWIHLPEGYKDWNEYHCDRRRALGMVEAI